MRGKWYKVYYVSNDEQGHFYVNVVDDNASLEEAEQKSKKLCKKQGFEFVSIEYIPYNPVIRNLRINRDRINRDQ